MPGTVVVPHLNWRGLFGKGTDQNGNPSTAEIEWPGFQTTASHARAPAQMPTKTWFGGVLEGMRDAGGTMCMRNRYYDPATGQLTQTDPIGIAGGLNTYGFANGDPVTYSDPYGLEAEAVAQPCRGRVSCALRVFRAWRTARALQRLRRSVRIVDAQDDVVEISARASRGDITIMRRMTREGDDLILSGTHIDGPGAGSLGREQLRVIAQEIGRQQGAKRVIVRGGTRTTGLTRGREPRPKTYDVPEQ